MPERTGQLVISYGSGISWRAAVAALKFGGKTGIENKAGTAYLIPPTQLYVKPLCSNPEFTFVLGSCEHSDADNTFDFDCLTCALKDLSSQENPEEIFDQKPEFIPIVYSQAATLLWLCTYCHSFGIPRDIDV